MRVWGFLVLFFVCGLAPAPAYAAGDYSGCTNTMVRESYCETASEASAGVRAYLEARGSDPRDTFCTPKWQYDAQGRPVSVMQVRKRYQYTETCADGALWGIRHVANPASCPAGTTFDPLTGRCKTECGPDEWPDPTNPGQCLSQQKCLSRNASLGDAPRVHSSDVSCVAGCRYALDSSQGAVRTTGPGGVKLFAGVWRYTGDQCGAEPPPPPDDEPDDPPKKQQCVPVAGQTLCIKPSGEHCYSASTGRQICWKPGETGDKPDGDTLQRRVAGPNEIPPNLNLPNGDTLTRSGNPITTTTTTNTTTITTTTTNYRTTNGTNAGTGNRGESADGSGGEGSDDDGTSASGGGDCKTPPVVQGDAALNMVAVQAWHTRCEAERLRKVTSSGTISDCSAPYTVEGNDAPAQQLRALRKSLCPLEGQGELPSESYLGTGDGEPTADDVKQTIEHDLSEFDTSGLGWGSSCPAIPSVNVFGTVIDLDPDGVVCDWVQIGGWFVLLCAGFACLKILWGA